LAIAAWVRSTSGTPAQTNSAYSHILSPQPEIVVQFTQLTLLPLVSPMGVHSRSHKHRPRNTHAAASRQKKPKVELRYLAFDDDYFWELIRKDYASAWKYVDRMTRIM
jgi:hypothetical protein